MMKAIRTLYHSLSPSCHEATRMKSLALDEPLPLSDRLGLNLHLLLCRCCRRYARQIQWLHGALQSGDLEFNKPAELRLSAAARNQMKEWLRRNRS